MIYLLNKAHTHIGPFANYHELVEYIHKSEIYQLRFLSVRSPPLEGEVDLAETKWRFAYYKHPQLNIIYSTMKEPPIKGIEKQAFDLGLDLIEIHQGDSANPLQIPVTQDIDIENLEKDWCLSYCKAHSYVLMETIEDKNTAERLVTGGANDMAL